MIQPPQPPYFEYQNQFDSKLFQKGIFQRPKIKNGKMALSITTMSFILWMFLSLPLILATVAQADSPSRASLIFPTILIIAFSLVFVYLIRQAEQSTFRQRHGKTVKSWISETHYMLSSPDNGVITAFPFSILSLLKKADEYIILEAGNQQIFIRRAGLQAAGLEEKFLALVNAPKT